MGKLLEKKKIKGIDKLPGQCYTIITERGKNRKEHKMSIDVMMERYNMSYEEAVEILNELFAE